MNNMNNFDRVTFLTNFHVYCIVPEQGRKDFPYVFQLTTLICLLMVFAHMLSDTLRTLADVDLQAYFGGFSCQQRLCVYVSHIYKLSFSFKRWQTCKSSGLNSCPIKDFKCYKCSFRVLHH